MFCNTLSNSKRDVWHQCKFKYGKQYVERADPDEDRNTDALQFGSYIHKILEDGVESESVEELQVLAEAASENYKYSKKKYPDKLVDKALKNFLRFNATLSETVDTELRFEVPIGEDMTYNGIIDRLLIGRDGGYLVLDYKTGREKKAIDLYNDPQLLGYTFAVHTLFKVPIEKIVCGHYYPLSDNLVTLRYSKAQINQFVKSLTNDMWNIRKCKKTQLTPERNQFCDWCAFKSSCPLFS